MLNVKSQVESAPRLHYAKTMKESESESHSVVSDSLRPHGLYSPWNSPGQNTGVGQPFPSLGDLPNTRIEPRSPALQADSLPQGKPKCSIKPMACDDLEKEAVIIGTTSWVQ